MQHLKASLERWVGRIQSEDLPADDNNLVRAAFVDSPIAMSMSSLETGKLLKVNDEWLRLTGYTLPEVIGSHVMDLGLWPDAATRQNALEKIFRTHRLHDLEMTLRFKDGVPRSIRWSGSLIFINGAQHLLVSLQDVSKEKAVSQALSDKLDFIQRITARMPDMLFQMLRKPDGTLSFPYASPAIQSLFGMKAEQVYASAAPMFELVHPDDLPDLKQSMRDAAQNGAVWRHEFRLNNRDGSIRWLLGNASVYIETNGNVQTYGALTDVTARKIAEEANQRLAFFDALTNLPNRRLLMDRLRQAQISGARTLRYGALMFLDLDHFKDINDSLGHDVGDELLVQVAERLAATVREGDTAARFGGDEFVVVIENLSDQEGAAVYQAEQVALKILASLNEPYELSGKRHFSTPSMGITLFQGLKLSAEDLLKHADVALYQAKFAGRNTLRFFDQLMQDAVVARAAMNQDISRALALDELTLYYQPVVDADKNVVSYEAYLRWNHPVRGCLNPGEFLDMNQSSPLVLAVNDWALTQACRQLGHWAGDERTRHLGVSVNISARSLSQPEFATQVLRILNETGADPHRLTLEFKETLPGDIDALVRKMRILREIGVRFALDDFGAGFSSLGLLKRLPLAQLKISRSFVRDANNSPDDAAMVRTLLSLAQHMDFVAVAEGVENFAQYDFLHHNGCLLFQGYLFGYPEPLSHWGLEETPSLHNALPQLSAELA